MSSIPRSLRLPLSRLRLPRGPGFPLLVKELVEQAARKRTYITRVLYAAGLFLIGGIALGDIMRAGAGGGGFNVLGRGRELFEVLVYTQFVGIYLFLPAMMCGVIAYEKERNSLVLVFLTDLRPWEILLQKLFSRLLPMITFLLLAMPLLAVAYALGGVTVDRLWTAIFLLIITMLQVGTLSLMMSAFCRTTVAAFIGTYLVGAAVYFAPFILYGVLWELTAGQIRQLIDDDWLVMWLPFVLFMASDRWPPLGNFIGVIFASIPALATIAVFLLLARLFLVRRAFLEPRNLLLRTFKFFDNVMNRANRLTGDVVLVKSGGDLPEDRPVAWREVTKRSLGKPHYLLRVLLAIELPILVLAAWMVTIDASPGRADVLSGLLFFLWPLAALIVAVAGANTIVAERTRQTLDVLLTTPMTGAEIVRQKTAALRRLVLVLFIPFLSIFLIEAWWEANSGYWSHQSLGWLNERTLLYLTCSVLSVVIYLPMVAWFSLWVSLRFRTQARAIMIALAALAAWVAVPPVLVILAVEMTGLWDLRQDLSPLMLLSPGTIIPFNEFDDLDEFWNAPWTAVIANFLFFGAVLYYLRWLCITAADRYLGRGVGSRES